MTSFTAPIIDLAKPQFYRTAGSNVILTALIADMNGNAIGSALMTTMTLSIYDTKTDSIVNSVQDVNILNTGRGQLDSVGNLQVTLTTADTAMLVSTDTFEIRSLVVKWTHNGGAFNNVQQINFALVALAGI